MKRYLLLITPILLLLSGCRHDKIFPDYETKYVVIIVIDGPRYSESWGEPSHFFIPNQSLLRSEGVFFDNFMNDGPTYTTPGHTAILTGNHQNINNNGLELPNNPSLFQVYRQTHGTGPSSTWLISSKDKLGVLANCSSAQWHNKYLPSSNCGVNGQGVGSGYRSDSITMVRAIEKMTADHPNIAMINFKDPDYYGHQDNWNAYLNGIVETDVYVQQIWDFIQNDPVYKDKTTLFVTNDHGRHLSSIQFGYTTHGDGCEGCKHISLLALGPDFTPGTVVSKHYNQTDLSQTVAELLHLNLKNGEGKLIRELLE